jgi:hypothetical protein
LNNSRPALATFGWLGVFNQGTIMNPRRTIQITRKNNAGEIEQAEVKLLYCAASETGFQTLSGETMDVFTPEFEKNEEGKFIIKNMPKATDENYIQLAMACIIAAYECDEEQPPISSKDLLYHASREEVQNLVTTVLQMRNEWMQVPSTIKPEMKERESKRKNVKTPTRPSK